MVEISCSAETFDEKIRIGENSEANLDLETLLGVSY